MPMPIRRRIVPTLVEPFSSMAERHSTFSQRKQTTASRNRSRSKSRSRSRSESRSRSRSRSPARTASIKREPSNNNQHSGGPGPRALAMVHGPGSKAQRRARSRPQSRPRKPSRSSAHIRSTSSSRRNSERKEGNNDEGRLPSGDGTRAQQNYARFLDGLEERVRAKSRRGGRNLEEHGEHYRYLHDFNLYVRYYLKHTQHGRKGQTQLAFLKQQFNKHHFYSLKTKHFRRYK